MKNFLIILFVLLATLATKAQNPRWFKHKDLFNFENFFKTTYVSSNTRPCVINHMQEVFQNIPNAPPIQPLEFLIAHDTSGLEIWSRKLVGLYHGIQSSISPIALLTKEKDRFWVVVGPATDTIKVGGQFMTSPYSDSLYNSYYFVEMHRTGLVLNYFTYANKHDIEFNINDIAFDGNGDFIIAGITRPNLNLNMFNSQPFSFGNYTATLVPDSMKHFVAKIHQNGTEGKIFQFDSSFPSNWTFSSVSRISKVGVNSINGDIVFIGMLGDTLAINSNTMINTTPFSQLFLGRIDSNFNYLSSKSETVATSGTFLHAMTFNPAANAFYFSGTWDGFLNYGQVTPLAGSTSNGGNDSYVAKLLPNSLNLDVILPIFPFPHTNQTIAMCYALDVANDGSVYMGGFVEDSLIDFGATQYRLNNPNLNEFPFISKMTANLVPDTSIFATTNGVSRFNAIKVGNNSVYGGGCINGTFSLGNVGATSTYQLDGALLKLDMPTAPVSDFSISENMICKGLSIDPVNLSWGLPTPSYSWTAQPSAGVTFSPSNTAMVPKISFVNAGMYTITCIATNSLGNSSKSMQQFVSVCSGISINKTSGELISVLPNPSEGHFQISIFAVNGDVANCAVVNSLGQLVLTTKINVTATGSFDIDLSDRENGIYFLSISVGDEKVMRKLVISK
jgi:hypothetical protein